MKVRTDRITNEAWLEDEDGIFHQATFEDLVIEIKSLRRQLKDSQSQIRDFLGLPIESKGL